MYSTLGCLLLIALQGISVNSVPFDRRCSSHQTNQIKEKYVKKIWNEAEDLEEIPDITREGTKKVNDRLKRLEQKIEYVINFAHDKGFDIHECLDFDYINNIPNAIQKDLRRYYEEIEDGSKDLHEYVHRSIRKVDACTDSHSSCKQIERCAKNVVEDFDDDVIEDGVEHLERVSRKRIQKITSEIDEEIKVILDTTKGCYLEHIQTTTTETSVTDPAETTDPTEEVSDDPESTTTA